MVFTVTALVLATAGLVAGTTELNGATFDGD
jgi:hypothetical protein